DDLVRAGEAVVGAPNRRAEAGRLELGDDLPRLFGRYQADVDAARLLEGDLAPAAGEVGLILDQVEVAVLTVVAARAHLLLEALEEGDARLREADLGLGAELGADPAGRLAG